MEIYVGGLDHSKANIEIREKFALTTEKKKFVIKTFLDFEYIKGCVVLSTCNRTEIYLSAINGVKPNIMKILCEALDIDFDEYNDYFFELESTEVIRHLCLVSAGVKSQILGDDQIITQVREAVEFSRDCNFNDSYIETLFKTSIQTAKKIKTDIVIRDIKASSAPFKTIEKLLSIYNSLENIDVLVIGNGQMGQLVVKLLLESKANVTVTLREYRKGIINVPNNVKTVLYHKRYEVLEHSEIVISATTSPHFTITYEDIENLTKHPKIAIDLAVPRDIDPIIEKRKNIKIFTIDDLGDKSYHLSQEKMEAINYIVEKNIEKYDKWCEYKKKDRKMNLSEIKDISNIKDENSALEKKIFFPFFVDLSSKKILVIGGGKIAERRVSKMIDYTKKITVISPKVSEFLEVLYNKESINIKRKFFELSDIKGDEFLIIACTDNRNINNTIGKKAEEMNILHIISDLKEECDCYFPALIENDEFICGVVSKDGNHKALKDFAVNLRGFLND